jgi:hypothetical protein
VPPWPCAKLEDCPAQKSASTRDNFAIGLDMTFPLSFWCKQDWARKVPKIVAARAGQDQRIARMRAQDRRQDIRPPGILARRDLGHR